MIKDDIEYDFQPRFVKRFNHVAETGQIVHRFPSFDVVTAMRWKKADRIVSPEIHQFFARNGISIGIFMHVKLMNRQQLDRCYAELF